jgi:STE24 endopeptidase
MHNTIFFIILIIPVTGFIVERYLDHLNDTMWSDTLPEKLKGICDEEEYRKSQLYQRDNKRLSFWSSLFNLAVILIMIIAGGFILIDSLARSISPNLVIVSLIFF